MQYYSCDLSLPLEGRFDDSAHAVRVFCTPDLAPHADDLLAVLDCATEVVTGEGAGADDTQQ